MVIIIIIKTVYFTSITIFKEKGCTYVININTFFFTVSLVLTWDVFLKDVTR